MCTPTTLRCLLSVTFAVIVTACGSSDHPVHIEDHEFDRDHPPRHPHAKYAGHVAEIAIDTLEWIDGHDGILRGLRNAITAAVASHPQRVSAVHEEQLV